MHFTSTLVAAVGVFSAVPSIIAAITISRPSSSLYWVQNTSNTISWQFSPGDPSPVSITITNPNSTFLNGPFAIAENVDLANKTFTVTNVTLNVHDGYVVNFVNGSNPAQLYAQSGAFSLKAPGTLQASPTTSGSSPSATGTAPAGSASVSSSGSATAGSASGTASSKPSSSLRSFDGSLMALAPMLGMGALMGVVGTLATL